MQIQQLNAALTQSHRDREELMAYITKISQQRMNEEAMDHSRNRFDSNSNNNNNGGYLHQQASSNGKYGLKGERTD